MKAHGDPIAGNYTFHEIITAPESAPQKVRQLRNRCLVPGIYGQHLQRWLDFFPARQVIQAIYSDFMKIFIINKPLYKGQNL